MDFVDLILRLGEERQPLSQVRSAVGVASVARFGSNYAGFADRAVGDFRTRAARRAGSCRFGVLHCSHAEVEADKRQ